MIEYENKCLRSTRCARAEEDYWKVQDMGSNFTEARILSQGTVPLIEVRQIDNAFDGLLSEKPSETLRESAWGREPVYTTVPLAGAV